MEPAFFSFLFVPVVFEASFFFFAPALAVFVVFDVSFDELAFLGAKKVPLESRPAFAEVFTLNRSPADFSVF